MTEIKPNTYTRYVVLDTETTGLSIDDGHKIIEIGCVELVDREFTRSTYHQYINPARPIDPAAIAVHGISNDFLNDKPLFRGIAEEFLAYIKGATLIIHNAPFDLGFLNYEFELIQKTKRSVMDDYVVVDTLEMARKKHPGQRNSLDALCKRYGIDLTQRNLHGALLDAYLLASVYLAMTGGQSNFFDRLEETTSLFELSHPSDAFSTSVGDKELLVVYANSDELATHTSYLESLKADGKCLWLASYDE